MERASERLRIDKWLWHARFCKTRALAQQVVQGGRVRVNGQRIDKPGRAVGPGDVLTLRIGAQVQVLRILDCGTRRGPASEAQGLYERIEPGADPER
ncbi:RNA-binding S4 domain-containing protein [Thioclava atlantica]|uniref:Heat shock protein n=1 Tax=Thioclava atlantica TaxID=1317124 RepID=A0A085U160_9RHOB|nr:RNA-binding S4 domain-containing protein [Thioclava atlantica]KFE36707.1 heat shock protein [Thioclava atlantica]